MPEVGTIAVARWEQRRSVPQSALRGYLLVALLAACAYYAGTKVGFLFTPSGQAISTLWPANALLFAILLLTPPRTWPITILAVLPAHLLVQLHRGIPILTAFGWYATNICEALLGAASVRAYCSNYEIPTHKLLKSTRGVASFMLLGVVFAPFLTSFLDIGVVVLSKLGHDFWRLWSERFLSNMLASVTIVPTVIVLSSIERPITAPLKRWLEAMLLATAIVLVVGVFLGVAGSTYGVAPLMYLVLPLLLWAAVRFGSEGVSTSLLLVALLVIWNALSGRGPFGTVEVKVRSMQLFLIAISGPLLSLGAVLDERREIEEQLREHTRFNGLVSQIAASFVNVSWDRIDDEIDRSLRRLLDFLGVDRLSLFDLTNQELRRRHHASLEAEAAAPLDAIAIEKVGRLIERMRLEGSVMINDVGQVPEGIRELKILDLAGVQSIAIVPLGRPDSAAGILAVASIARKKSFHSDLVSQLEILGEIFYDAMQRKGTFQALAESEQRFRYTADCSPMLIWMSGANGLCTYFNKGWLEFTGIALEKQTGEGRVQLLHPEDVDGCVSTYNAAFAARRRFNMEYRIRRHDGSFRWLFEVGAPRFDAEGTFLGFIGSAVDITERKNAEKAVTGLSRKLIKAQEEERRRIARELHDDVGQRLTLMALELDRFSQQPDSSFQRAITDLLDQAREISDSVHNMSHNLHSAGLDVLPLGTLLKTLCREFRKKTSTEMQFGEHDVPSRLPQEIKLCLYRVAQESLQNVVKHSRAQRATIELTGNERGLTLIVADDGIGFEGRSFDGLGMASMRERLGSVAGKIKITSAPMQGTRVEAYVPLHGDRVGDSIKVA
jgi:PAS domain S-box-containing protein